MGRNNLPLLLAWLIIMSSTILIYAGVSLWLIYDKSFYLMEFERNRIYENFDDKTLPAEITSNLITYFLDGSGGLPDIAQFNTAEKGHLLDVKLIIQKLRSVAFLSLIILLATKLLSYIFFRKFFLEKLSKVLLLCGIAAIGVGLVIILLTLNFPSAFTVFHHLFFPQGNWLFPAESTLIRLFPEQFFSDFFYAILLRCLILGSVLAILGISLSFIRKDYKKQSIFG